MKSWPFQSQPVDIIKKIIELDDHDSLITLFGFLYRGDDFPDSLVSHVNAALIGVDENNPTVQLITGFVSAALECPHADRRAMTLATVCRDVLATRPHHAAALCALAFLIKYGHVAAQAADFPHEHLADDCNGQAASLLRRLLHHSPHCCSAINSLALLIQDGHVLAKPQDFSGTVIPADKFAQAASLYRRALSLSPNYANAKNNLARLIEDGTVLACQQDFPSGEFPVGQYQQAAQLYRCVLSVFANNAYARSSLTNLILQGHVIATTPDEAIFAKQYTVAATHYREILVSSPTNSSVLMKLANLIKHGYVQALPDDFPEVPMPATATAQWANLCRRAMSATLGCSLADLSFIHLAGEGSSYSSGTNPSAVLDESSDATLADRAWENAFKQSSSQLTSRSDGEAELGSPRLK